MFTVALPLALAFIMFSLGLSLTPADFVFALRRPHPLLACCPGGITSNVMTRLARGDVALSISFTALASLITTVTLPLILTLAGRALIGTALPPVSITGLGLKMFVMTTLPVVMGVVMRQRRPGWAGRWEGPFEQGANGLFALILAITIVGEWRTLMDNLGALGPVLLSLNLGMLAIGTAVAHLLRLPPPQVTCVAIESGFQNGTVGIAVGALLASAGLAGSALSPYSLPSAVYGVLMMVTILPYLAWRRSLPPLPDGIQLP